MIGKSEKNFGKLAEVIGDKWNMYLLCFTTTKVSLIKLLNKSECSKATHFVDHILHLQAIGKEIEKAIYEK